MTTQEQKRNPLPLIYFVEDDQDDRNILQDIVANMPGCLAAFFTDGFQLVAQLDQTTDQGLPALMVLDQRLPKWDGDALLQALKLNPRYSAIPVVILSSAISVSKKASLLNAGAWKVEEKPNTLGAYDHLVRQLVAFAVQSS